jgi:hypothetical protein
MLKLKINNVIPTGGWVYTHPSTGFVVTAPTWNDLILRIRKYRIANGISLGTNFEETIGSEICQQQGWSEPNCMQEEPTSLKLRSIRMQDVVGFLKVLKHWLLNNPVFVEPEEAERRAGICATCPYNVDVSGCMGCTNIAGLIFNVTGDRTTSHDLKLRNCQMCGCVNKAQVWVPQETLAQGLTLEIKESLPEWCWKKQG